MACAILPDSPVPVKSSCLTESMGHPKDADTIICLPLLVLVALLVHCDVFTDNPDIGNGAGAVRSLPMLESLSLRDGIAGWKPLLLC